MEYTPKGPYTNVPYPDNPPAGAKKLDAAFFNDVETALQEIGEESATYAVTRLDTSAGTRRMLVLPDGTEEMLTGDTGLRNISSLATGTSSARVDIERYGPRISIYFFGCFPSSTGLVQLIPALPAGFTPFRDARATLITAGGTARLLEASAADYVRMFAATAESYSGQITFKTNDPWPTTLPGTPA